MNCARASGRTTAAPAVATAAPPPAPVLVMASPLVGSAPAVVPLPGALFRVRLGEGRRTQDGADDGAGRGGHPRAADDGGDGYEHGLRLLHRQTGVRGGAERDGV